MKKILAIDGGGVRGIIAAYILKEIESRTGRKLHQIFDVITGTSTGAVIALLATRKTATETPYTAEEILEIYRDALPDFFTRRFGFGLCRPKYKSGPAEQVLQDHLGNAELKDAPTRVLIPLYALRDHVPRVVYFSSLAAENDADENFLMWKVARGSTAAPTYFSAFDVPSLNNSVTHCAVDGGVYANNPALHGWLHAYEEFDAAPPPPGRRRSRRFRVRPGAGIPRTGGNPGALVLSVGTGRTDDPIARHHGAAGWGLLRWARPLLDVMFEGQSDAVDDLLATAKEGDLLKDHFRLQPTLADEVKLDDTGAIPELEAIAEQFVEDNEQDIQDICDKL